ncbi:hypothetical protein [Streptomyces sp. NPDC050416]|uniref:hypothetical protein n=1 Tax=Streptomyces sp. NPDC050416 TaxID=3365611 RepID=UPI0037BA8C3A
MSGSLPGTVSACGGGSAADAPSSPAARPTVSASASSVVYKSKAFAVPLTVAVPASLGARPDEDTRTFLTWDTSESDKVSFLLPVVVYPPGKDDPVEPPASYKGYLARLRGLTDYHATFRDTVETTVDGHPATLMTATTDWSLNGTLGCPGTGQDAHDDCYGLQPEYALRVTVIDIGKRTPLVSWTTVNTDQQRDTSAAFTRYEAMLRSLKFSDSS